MPRKLLDNFFTDPLYSDAQDLRQALDASIAPFLQAGALGQFDEHLRQEGVCIALFDNLTEHRTRRLPNLPDGFSLPAQWRHADGAHDPFLPKVLVDTATAVCTAVKPNKPWRLCRLGIHEHLDFSELPLEGGSAFVPLAAALILAQQGVVANPAVFSTGAWNAAAGSLSYVALGGKPLAVGNSGLADARLFAPAVAAGGGGAVPLVSLPAIPGKPVADQLAPLLAAMDAPPNGDKKDPSALQPWCAYLNRPHNRSLQMQHYADLAPNLGNDAHATGCKQQGIPAQGEIKHLVVAVATQPTSAILAIATWRPLHVHLLVSTAAEKSAANVQQFCSRASIQASCYRAPDLAPPNDVVRDDLLDQPRLDTVALVAGLITGKLAKATTEGSGRQLLAVDVTAGLASMTTVLSLAADAARAEIGRCCVLYVWSEYVGASPKLGTAVALLVA